MASKDSDYDVRFVFFRKPESYISLNTQNDVINIAYDENEDETIAMIRQELKNRVAELESENKIQRFGSGGTARYDGNISPHYHLSCLGCSGVVDIFLDSDCGLTEKAAKSFDGTIISHSVLFTGYCSECSKQLG